LNQQPISQQLTRPPIAIGVIAVCVVLFLLQNVPLQSSFGQMIVNILNHMALWPINSPNPQPWQLSFQPWQLVSYGFLHGSFNHLFFNMFALWMFGLPIEKMWGSRKFAEYYFICIVGAGLVQLLVQYLSGGNSLAWFSYWFNISVAVTIRPLERQAQFSDSCWLTV